MREMVPSASGPCRPSHDPGSTGWPPLRAIDSVPVATPVPATMGSLSIPHGKTRQGERRRGCEGVADVPVRGPTGAHSGELEGRFR